METNEARLKAKKEIDGTLKLSLKCMLMFGFSLEAPETHLKYLLQKTLFILSLVAIFYHCFADIIFLVYVLSESPKVEDVVPLFHTFGYGLLSLAKLLVIWFKRDVFRQLLDDLVDIWPVSPLDQEGQLIKDKSLAQLRIAHQWYYRVNAWGVWFYNLSPIGIYLYKNYWLNEEAAMGFIWNCWYPFDKRKPVAHFFVYILEIFEGQTCVWAMVASDLLFTGIASHICMLLRLLQQRFLALGAEIKSNKEQYQDLIDSIKIHQRLILYCNEIEKAFSIVNLINIVLSSVNICCVVFVIVLLEPLVAVSNKFFLASALIQVGVICWYGDDIFHTNAEVGSAAYNSCWYQMDSRCRRALIFIIKRCQKPIAFTAMNFTNITLVTYASILQRSYSYFALLYTMFSEK